MKSAEELAAEFIGGPAKLWATKTFGAYTVSYWSEPLVTSPILLVICDNVAEPYVISRDASSMERFLKDLRPSLAEIEFMFQLLNTVRPRYWSILDKLESIALNIDRYPDMHFANGQVVFFVNDSSKRMILRVCIDSEYNVSAEIVGKGVLTGVY